MIQPLAKFLLVISITFLLISCGGEDVSEREAQHPVAVKAAEAIVQPLASRSTYSGTVQPIERVQLSTKIMGGIDRIYFEEGEVVGKGVTLVKLRSEDIEAKRAQAEAAIAEAEVHFKNARTNLQRLEALFEKKAATQKELDDMRAAFASAQAAMKTAQEMKKEVNELLKYTVLSAPFDGVVTGKMLQEGDLANPGQPILEVENMSVVKIVAKVPENEILDLEVGMPVTVVVQASNVGTNGNHHTYPIDRIVPAADPASRQFEVQVLVDNSGGRLKSGMFARIVVGNSQEMTLLVPAAAVFRRGQLEGVFVVDGESKVRLRWIRTGVRQEGLIEVLSGLNAGDQVVVQKTEQLLDGQSVEVEE